MLLISTVISPSRTECGVIDQFVIYQYGGYSLCYWSCVFRPQIYEIFRVELFDCQPLAGIPALENMEDAS